MKMTHNINEKNIHMLLSINLKRLRGLQNLSQLELALKAGLTHNFINDIENCKKGISAKTLAKLSAALKVEPHQFYMPDNFPNNDVYVYMSDFTDSVEKALKEVADQYLAGSKKEIRSNK